MPATSPALAHGYRLPAYRFAIEVVEWREGMATPMIKVNLYAEYRHDTRPRRDGATLGNIEIRSVKARHPIGRGDGTPFHIGITQCRN
jgi:hypothetical protein